VGRSVELRAGDDGCLGPHRRRLSRQRQGHRRGDSEARTRMVLLGVLGPLSARGVVGTHRRHRHPRTHVHVAGGLARPPSALARPIARERPPTRPC
jgi:hypothetical protein